MKRYSFIRYPGFMIAIICTTGIARDAVDQTVVAQTFRENTFFRVFSVIRVSRVVWDCGDIFVAMIVQCVQQFCQAPKFGHF